MATIRVDTSHATREIRRMESVLTGAQIRRATARAINHTLAKSKTGAASAMLKRYAMKSAGIKKKIPVRKAFARKPFGSLDASTRPIPLISMKGGARQNRRGVSVQVIPGRRKTIRSAFIITTKAGRRGVFARGEYKGGEFKFRHKRIVKSGPDMPIAELTTVSLYKAGLSDDVQNRIQSIVKGSYTERLKHEMKHIIARESSK